MSEPLPTMGRLIDHDERNRDYPAMALFGDAPGVLKTKTWRRGLGALNQGKLSACVGYTFAGILNTAPFAASVPSKIRLKYDPVAFYRGGQLNDQWPGEEPAYYGTSAGGVCKYLKKQGIITEYRWCFGYQDMLAVLSNHGPVACGFNWRSGMMQTDANGFIHPTGSVVGGHEVEIHGINIKSKYVVGTNSWGKSWGQNGRFKISFDNLGALLVDRGDAVTLVKLA